MWDGWVIDASMSDDEIACLIPYKGSLEEPDCHFVEGMNRLTSVEEALKEADAIVHPDGQVAVEHFLQRYPRYCPQEEDQ
jgi:hypothetical protein